LSTGTDSTGTDIRQCQQTGEYLKMISYMIFIAKQLTDDGRNWEWNMCREINTDRDFSSRSLKGADHLAHLVVNVKV
jgi:hypothetical protein